MKAVGMDIGTTSISGVVLELEETGEQKIKRILEVKTVKKYWVFLHPAGVGAHAGRRGIRRKDKMPAG